ncbi:MAG TPA: ring-cleaving dioxygenase [Opitutaceae bacterium]|nr:ring-cleaving dioxygenase [Opitutaceae bacterium]
MEDSGLALTGIHHLTAVTAKAPENYNFYTQVLGLRLVKKTVNQDDVSAYHLFYADGKATPGTDITFFDWPASPERRGTRSVVQTGFRVSGQAALKYWKDRFMELKVRHGEIVEHDGRSVLDFDDNEGQRLSLVDDKGVGSANPWDKSTVPSVNQIRGLGPIRVSVPEIKPTDRVLTSVMGMKSSRTYALADESKSAVYVYTMAGEGPGSELHVVVDPNLPPARLGAGGVHHVAFRTPDEDQYNAWAERLEGMGMPTSGPVDRFYFQSLYFREPGGVLFEIATDGPGFATDEPMDSLGQRLALPPFLEGRRKEIEAGLKPLAV